MSRYGLISLRTTKPVRSRWLINSAGTNSCAFFNVNSNFIALPDYAELMGFSVHAAVSDISNYNKTEALKGRSPLTIRSGHQFYASRILRQKMTASEIAAPGNVTAHRAAIYIKALT